MEDFTKWIPCKKRSFARRSSIFPQTTCGKRSKSWNATDMDIYHDGHHGWHILYRTSAMSVRELEMIRRITDAAITSWLTAT